MLTTTWSNDMTMQAREEVNDSSALFMTAPDVARALGVRRGKSSFPPIGDYGFLSDCQVMALIAPSGNVEWLCVPRPDSPSVFATILDRDGGGFRLGRPMPPFQRRGHTCPGR